MKQTLYKLATNGKTQQWTIETEEAAFRISEGYVGGAITTTMWTECVGKRIGASNETTPGQQANKEVSAILVKKKKEGWTEDIAKIADENVIKKIKPQLAHKYEDHIEDIFKWELIAVQPKLDGIRAIGVNKEGAWTRKGKKHIAAPHIDNFIQFLFENIRLPLRHLKFDGEFYNHKFHADFNEIASIVRKSKPTPEDLEKSKNLMQYHLYDIDLPNATFKERFEILKNAFSNTSYAFLSVVETVFIEPKDKYYIKFKLDELHKRWVNEGYEGSMIRNAGSLYKNGRSKDLLKRKDWIDDEFKLVDILAGKGNKAGMAASVECVDLKGECFSAGILGDNKYCTTLLLNKHLFLGQMVTIKYQNLTPDRKVPRFAKMKAIRDYE